MTLNVSCNEKGFVQYECDLIILYFFHFQNNV